jgi:predicted ATP-grasp superfamily ATP-dependent carboligase
MRVGVLILSGFNIRAVVAFCRRAAAARLPVHLVARNAGDPIYLTDYGTHVFEERTSAQLEPAAILEWIRRLRTEHGYARVFIVPSTEFLNRVLLKHRDAIEAAGGIVPLVSRNLYEQISDKHAFAGLCSSRGLCVPATFERIPDRFPFVAKPKAYGAAKSGQIKPYLIFSSDDLARFLAREEPSRFFLQEFVEGRSLYLLAHVAKNGAVTACAQENLIQQPHGGSIVLARTHAFHRHPAADGYLRLLREVGFHGLIMIEVRECAHTGRHVMIEANPRLWGPLQFTLDQGVDILGAWLADSGFTLPPLTAPSPLGHYYFWSGGLAHGDAPETFHYYSAERFREDYETIAAADLFCRPDTQRLYEHELAETCLPIS